MNTWKRASEITAIVVLLFALSFCNNTIREVHESTEETVEDCWRRVEGGCTFMLGGDGAVRFSDSCPGYRIVKWKKREYRRKWVNDLEYVRIEIGECK